MNDFIIGFIFLSIHMIGFNLVFLVNRNNFHKKSNINHIVMGPSLLRPLSLLFFSKYVLKTVNNNLVNLIIKLLNCFVFIVTIYRYTNVYNNKANWTSYINYIWNIITFILNLFYLGILVTL